MLSRWQRLRMRADFRLGRPTPLCLEGSGQALQAIFDRDAGLVRVATGLRFTEGPVWHPHEQRLLFSDIPASRIYEILPDRTLSTRHAPSDNANGLAVDRAGLLLACEHGTRRVTRRGTDGKRTVLADAFEGTRLNSPNDLVIAQDGAVWFTDPPYGIPRDAQELPFQGVFRVGTDGSLQLVFPDFDRPNGLAFSPDEQTLYVADSSARRHIRAFPIGGDGTPGNGQVFVDMAIATSGVPDGMKVALDGVVYSTGPGGIWLIEPTGKVLGVLAIPETPTNCAFGDADGQGLYVTAGASLYHVRLRRQAIVHAR